MRYWNDYATAIRRRPLIGCSIDVAATGDGTVSEWISVNDRLPDGIGYYVTYAPGYYGISIMEWRTPELTDVLQWWADEWSPTSTVTHWMPLPEPPNTGPLQG